MVGMPASLDQAVLVVQPIIEQAQRVLERCAQCAEPDKSDFQPTLFLFTARRGVDILGMSWDCQEEKDAAALAIRLAACAAQPLGLWGVMLITDSRRWTVDVPRIARATGRTEAWVKDLLEHDPDQIRRLVKPQDVLQVTLETYLGDYRLNLAYDRLSDGRIAWHAPEVAPSMEQHEGRFANFLPPLAVPGTGAQA
jgi:hypothetical protein